MSYSDLFLRRDPVPATSAQTRDVRHLGDFSVTARMTLITGLSLPIGAVAACVSWALLRLIGLITNAAFYQRVSTDLVAPGAPPTTTRCWSCSRPPRAAW
jgi:hypothetical protein